MKGHKRSNLGPPLVSVEGVHKAFTAHGQVIEILRGVDMTVLSGDSMAITGASGAGKSTLLNIMGSLDPPTQGRVRFRERDLYRMDNGEINRLRNWEIGFVFQFHQLLPEFNAL